jgi:hypothetical protein
MVLFFSVDEVANGALSSPFEGLIILGTVNAFECFPPKIFAPVY